VYLVGRLAPGLTVESATPRLPATAAAMAEAFPAQYGEQELSIAPLPRFGTSTNPVDESALSLVAAVFIGMTTAVLLIVCLTSRRCRRTWAGAPPGIHFAWRSGAGMRIIGS
jgi:hypothetical protein